MNIEIKKPYVGAQGITISEKDSKEAIIMVPHPSKNTSPIPPELYSEHSRKRAEKLKEMAKTPEEQVLGGFNKRYAIVRTSTTYILVEKKGESFVLDSRRSFIQFHENDFFTNSLGKQEGKAMFWLRHPGRRTYENIVFDPITPGDHDGCYNIFKGFAVEPAEGDCQLYWQHVKEIICGGNSEHYRYVRKWMASVIQNPADLATALVLRGLQGTGKNTFVDHFGALFGRYFLTVTSMEHVCGKFNNHLKEAYLIHANEALWGGSKKEVGALKALITDRIIMIEGKGKDAIPIANCRHLIVSSNEDWAVPMDLDDRRFFPLDVRDFRKEDTQYFAAIYKQMCEQRGREALLYDLLHEDLSDFDPRKMPLNDSGFDMKMKSATTVVKFIYEALKEGRYNLALTDPNGAWEPCPSERLHYCYKEWCKNEGLRHEAHSEFGRQLQKLLKVQKCRRSVQGNRQWWYELAPLGECRKTFEAFTKQTGAIWES